MRKFLTFLIALGAIVFAVGSPARADCVAVPGLPPSGTGCAFSYPPSSGGGGVPFGIDGGSTTENGNLSPYTVSLTTTQGSGLIVVAVYSQLNTTGISSVSGLGLTWTQTLAFTLGSGDFIYFYTAPYTSNVSGNITITNVANGYGVASVMAVSGAKAVSFQDSGSPQTSSAGAPALTTANGPDAVIAYFLNNNATGGAGADWTGMPGASTTNYVFGEYQFPGVTGTYTASLSGGGTVNGGIIIAVEKGP